MVLTTVINRVCNRAKKLSCLAHIIIMSKACQFTKSVLYFVIAIVNYGSLNKLKLQTCLFCFKKMMQPHAEKIYRDSEIYNALNKNRVPDALKRRLFEKESKRPRFKPVKLGPESSVKDATALARAHTNPMSQVWSKVTL